MPGYGQGSLDTQMKVKARVSLRASSLSPKSLRVDELDFQLHLRRVG